MNHKTLIDDVLHLTFAAMTFLSLILFAMAIR